MRWFSNIDFQSRSTNAACGVTYCHPGRYPFGCGAARRMHAPCVKPQGCLAKGFGVTRTVKLYPYTTYNRTDFATFLNNSVTFGNQPSYQ